MISQAKFYRFSIALKDFEKAADFLSEAYKHPVGSLIHEALIFSAIICYFRPFSSNEIQPSAAAAKLDLSEFSALSADELAIHENCKELRNKALAHAEFKYHPVNHDPETGVISSKLFSLVSLAPDPRLFSALVHKLIEECHNKRADYVVQARGSKN